MTEHVKCSYCYNNIENEQNNYFHCCHYPVEFIIISNNLYKLNKKMMDDFVYTQPVNLVKDALIPYLLSSGEKIDNLNNYTIVKSHMLKYIVEDKYLK